MSIPDWSRACHQPGTGHRITRAADGTVLAFWCARHRSSDDTRAMALREYALAAAILGVPATPEYEIAFEPFDRTVEPARLTVCRDAVLSIPEGHLPQASAAEARAAVSAAVRLHAAKAALPAEGRLRFGYSSIAEPNQHLTGHRTATLDTEWTSNLAVELPESLRTVLAAAALVHLAHREESLFKEETIDIPASAAARAALPITMARTRDADEATVRSFMAKAILPSRPSEGGRR